MITKRYHLEMLPLWETGFYLDAVKSSPVGIWLSNRGIDWKYVDGISIYHDVFDITASLDTQIEFQLTWNDTIIYDP